MKGLLLRADNPITRSQARRRGLAVEVSEELALPFDQTLVASGTIPWDLVDQGFRALDRWDVAVPLDGQLAEDVGGDSDQAATKRIVRDLRVPLCSVDLMFWQRNAGTEALVEAWREEWRGHGDPRLAFLRALYIVKPLVLALPRTWLSLANVPQQMVISGRRTSGNNGLIHVQIAPGRSVCCRPEEADHYREMFGRMHVGRR